MLEKIRVFSGNANVRLAQKICENLGISLGQAHVTSFSDGETRVEINENVRGMDVFIIQPTCPPATLDQAGRFDQNSKVGLRAQLLRHDPDHGNLIL